MPIRKVWRESRWRFFFILAALLVVTSASVFYNAKAENVVIVAASLLDRPGQLHQNVGSVAFP
jgi:hypothetical protein